MSILVGNAQFASCGYRQGPLQGRQVWRIRCTPSSQIRCCQRPGSAVPLPGATPPAGGVMHRMPLLHSITLLSWPLIRGCLSAVLFSSATFSRKSSVHKLVFCTAYVGWLQLNCPGRSLWQNDYLWFSQYFTANAQVAKVIAPSQQILSFLQSMLRLPAWASFITPLPEDERFIAWVRASCRWSTQGCCSCGYPFQQSMRIYIGVCRSPAVCQQVFTLRPEYRRVMMRIQVSYAIGVAKPLSVHVDTYGTGKKPDKEILAAVLKKFDFRPGMSATQ